MTSGSPQLEYRKLRAPQEDRTAVAEPPFAQIGGVVDANVRLRRSCDYDAQGRSLAQLAAEARSELLAEARRFTSSYRDVPAAPQDPAGLIFLAGHQPQLFHPGVWLKNFALAQLARQHAAAAVNLLIDSDIIRSTTLRVPGGTVSAPRRGAIAFDRPEPVVPYEMRRIVDRQTFAALGRRVAECMAALVADPLIESYWPMVLGRAAQTDNLGLCLAQSRHQLEGIWGLDTLEVPQSRVCETASFCWFAAHLLARMRRFREVYNEAVQEYRRVHRIRSPVKPVPDLAADGDWLETPLWVFSVADPRRRRLFARRRGGQVVLSDRQSLEIALPLAPDGDAGQAVERLRELNRQGVKIRSRAILTTLWARLVLGDLFLHGIGGAQYDQVTDLLIARFFGREPPGFMVLSATLHLPVERPRAKREDLRAIRQELRGLVYHPERHLSDVGGHAGGELEDPGSLIAEKARWIRTSQTPQNARTRCRAIRQINRALQPWVEPRRRQLRELEAATDRALQAQAVLAWREYGFCLYPEKMLREFLVGLLPKNA